VSEPLSGEQLTRLGERIRGGKEEPGDDVLLADYLLSFETFADNVFSEVLVALVAAAPLFRISELQFSERTVKSSQSIADKLSRQPTFRLNQIQDIVGCRIITPLAHQPSVVRALLGQFPGCDLVDRRMKPTNGYRAVHIIVKRDRRRYEVQVRTKLQHLWATLVERLIGRFGIDIKYGGGPPGVQASLQDISRLIDLHESLVPGTPDVTLASEIRARLDELNGILGE